MITLLVSGFAMPWNTPFDPIAKKHLRAFLMLCSMLVFGERSGDHHTPRQRQESEGVMPKGRSCKSSSVSSEGPEMRSSHLVVFSYRKF